MLLITVPDIKSSRCLDRSFCRLKKRIEEIQSLLSGDTLFSLLED